MQYKGTQQSGNPNDPEYRIFGSPICDASDELLQQMKEQLTQGRPGSVYVSNKVTGQISLVVGTELVFAGKLGYKTHHYEELNTCVTREVTRRESTRRCLGDLLRKVENLDGEELKTRVADVWKQMESERRPRALPENHPPTQREPREVPPRKVLRIEDRTTPGSRVIN